MAGVGSRTEKPDGEAPPRRLGIRDAGAREVGPRLLILLDGEPQRNVVEYDCDRGIVVRHKLDDHGHLVRARDGKAVEAEILTGRVEARWK